MKAKSISPKPLTCLNVSSADDLSLITVTHNSAQAIPPFLDSYREFASEFQLVVVDSCSTDDTVAVVKKLAPDAGVIELQENLGYSAGINAASGAIPLDNCIVILNPDIELRAGAMKTLYAAVCTPGVGIAVPKILDANGELDYSVRRDPTIGRAFGEAFMGGDRAGRYSALGEVDRVTEHYDTSRTVAWASGAALAISPECRAAIGPWDTSLFLYSEELDYMQRARAAGFSIQYTPDAVVTHRGGDSHVSPELWATLIVNKVRAYARTHGPLNTSAFWSAIALNELLRTPRSATHRRALKALLGKRFWPEGLRSASARD